MDTDTAETKVQIRLSTRDPNLQIAEEPTTLLVQTCKSISYGLAEGGTIPLEQEHGTRSANGCGSL